MSNAAFPQIRNEINRTPEDRGKGGLTKREYFAAKAMQGLISGALTADGAAKYSVKAADALIAELENPVEPSEHEEPPSDQQVMHKSLAKKWQDLVNELTDCRDKTLPIYDQGEEIQAAAMAEIKRLRTLHG